MRECRNYGIGLVLCDQLSNLTHEELQANIGTRILFRIKNQGSLGALKTELALTEEQKTDIMNLPNRHIVVKLPNLPPFKARVPNLL